MASVISDDMLHTAKKPIPAHKKPKKVQANIIFSLVPMART